jgi:hypothetical protein
MQDIVEVVKEGPLLNPAQELIVYPAKVLALIPVPLQTLDQVR